MSQKQLTNLKAHSQDDQIRYIVVALPRSGTAWVANFLTWGDSFCFHEALYGCDSLDRFDHILTSTGAKYAGAAETAAPALLPALYHRFPHAKYIFIMRDIEEIRVSLERINVTSDYLNNMVLPFWWGIGSIENALVVQYKKLFTSTTMKVIWKHIGIKESFPFRRLELLRNIHMEDGFSSGFGRFSDPELVRENTIRYGQLCKSLGNEYKKINFLVT